MCAGDHVPGAVPAFPSADITEFYDDCEDRSAPEFGCDGDCDSDISQSSVYGWDVYRLSLLFISKADFQFCERSGVISFCVDICAECGFFCYCPVECFKKPGCFFPEA